MFILVVQSLVINVIKTNNVNTYHDIKTYNKAFNLFNNYCKFVEIILICFKTWNYHNKTISPIYDLTKPHFIFNFIIDSYLVFIIYKLLLAKHFNLYQLQHKYFIPSFVNVLFYINDYFI